MNRYGKTSPPPAQRIDRHAGFRSTCVLGLCAILALYGWVSPAGADVPASELEEARASDRNAANVVTADIQAGIEGHIERETQRGNGSFTVSFDDETLHLSLVRVHTEYLANLGPKRHFACVDLVTSDGDVFDVDFFLEGDPGGMSVTETTVHKRNGIPFYVWQQEAAGTWSRVEVNGADRSLLGVIEGEDRFRFSYEFTLPAIRGDARLWLPLPQNDDFQTVHMVESTAPVPWKVLEDEAHGNDVIFMALERQHSGTRIRFVYDVQRVEKSVYPAADENPERYLEPARLIPDDERFHRIAGEVLEGKSGELVRARALYDHVTEEMKYAKYDDEYGRGDAVYACDAQTGNCTDFHSYFIALARAAGIPARFAIGASIPSERNAGGISGYHCWAEFYAQGQWWPIDVSESDKFSALSTYYFGHHPANRIELSRGRDLVVEPGPDSGPINFLAYPLLEIDGQPRSVKPFFSFIRPEGDQASRSSVRFARRDAADE